MSSSSLVAILISHLVSCIDPCVPRGAAWVLRVLEFPGFLMFLGSFDVPGVPGVLEVLDNGIECPFTQRGPKHCMYTPCHISEPSTSPVTPTISSRPIGPILGELR